MTVVLVLIFCCLAAVLAFLVLAAVHLKKLEDQVLCSIKQFVEKPDDNTPSPLAKTIEYAAQVAASEITQSLKGSLMGTASAVSKAMDGIENDVADAVLAEKNPIAAALMQLPAIQKRTRKLPMLKAALANLNLTDLMRGGVGAGAAGSGPAKNNRSNGHQSTFGF